MELRAKLSDRVLCTNLWIAIGSSEILDKTICVVCEDMKSLYRIRRTFERFVKKHYKIELHSLLSLDTRKQLIFFNGPRVKFITRQTLFSDLCAETFDFVLYEDGVTEKLTPNDQREIAVHSANLRFI